MTKYYFLVVARLVALTTTAVVSLRATAKYLHFATVPAVCERLGAAFACGDDHAAAHTGHGAGWSSMGLLVSFSVILAWVSVIFQPASQPAAWGSISKYHFNKSFGYVSAT